MPTFEKGTVVRVPFPYTDRPVHQRRPALVVSQDTIGDAQQLLWVVMITSAENRRWPNDIDLSQSYGDVGLPAASLIRPDKIATVEAAHAEPLGKVGPDVFAAVDTILQRRIGLSV